MGHQSVPICCWRTAPMATSEASVMIQVRASGLGCAKRDAVAKASLIWLKALSAGVTNCREEERFGRTIVQTPLVTKLLLLDC